MGQPYSKEPTTRQAILNLAVRGKQGAPSPHPSPLRGPQESGRRPSRKTVDHCEGWYNLDQSSKYRKRARDSSSMPSSTTCDIIIIGGGSAALEAAISAREAGAGSVVMLEKAPEAESGGNARFSHTGFRFLHAGAGELRAFLPDVEEAKFRRMQIPAYGRADFLGDLEQVTQGRIDPVLAACLVDQSNTALHWMRAIGVRWEPEKMTEVDGKLYLPGGHHIHSVGGGPGMLDQLRALALRHGVEIRYRARVRPIHGTAPRLETAPVYTPQSHYHLPR